MKSGPTADAELRGAATRTRVESRTDERRRKIAILQQPGGIAKADEPERVASRLDRLSRFYSEIMRTVDDLRRVIEKQPQSTLDSAS